MREPSGNEHAHSFWIEPARNYFCIRFSVFPNEYNFSVSYPEVFGWKWTKKITSRYLYSIFIFKVSINFSFPEISFRQLHPNWLRWCISLLTSSNQWDWDTTYACMRRLPISDEWTRLKWTLCKPPLWQVKSEKWKVKSENEKWRVNSYVTAALKNIQCLW